MTYEIGTILLYKGDPYLVRKEGISRWIKKTQKFSGTAYVMERVRNEGTVAPADHPAYRAAR